MNVLDKITSKDNNNNTSKVHQDNLPTGLEINIQG